MAKNVPKFPIIGGPLDGKFANNKDFQAEWIDTYSRKHPPRPVRDQPEGQFHAHQDEYVAFNNASGRDHTGWASMIWIHRSLLSPGVRLPQ